MDQFHIRFERSGGFTAISSSIEFISDTLPAGEVNELVRLIENSEFFKHKTTGKSEKATGVRDQFVYQLTIQSGDHKKTIQMQEAEIPDPMRPLIDFLNRKLRLHR